MVEGVFIFCFLFLVVGVLVGVGGDFFVGVIFKLEIMFFFFLVLGKNILEDLMDLVRIGL